MPKSAGVGSMGEERGSKGLRTRICGHQVAQIGNGLQDNFPRYAMRGRLSLGVVFVFLALKNLSPTCGERMSCEGVNPFVGPSSNVALQFRSEGLPPAPECGRRNAPF